ncbi:hypothetical protein, partial [Acinetobacter baumannii]|uniref:hypothetical protein n=1 Tax=Acinetobacter baumannii TaxID=470 RepID=UPI001489D2C4
IGLVEILDQPFFFRLPAKQGAGFRARRRDVDGRKGANQPKCASASSIDFETTGTPSRLPITSAITLNDTPSSALACLATQVD